MAAFLALQLTATELLSGTFCDFLTPLLLLWTVTRRPAEALFLTAVLGVLASAIFPQPLPFLVCSLLAAQWIWLSTFLEDWRRRPLAVFRSGLGFSLLWQGAGLVYASIFSDPLKTPLCLPAYGISALTAGALATAIFSLAAQRAEMRGERW